MLIIDEYLVEPKDVKDWIPYPGEYEKLGCDIRLINGEEWGTCWPNAGTFLFLGAKSGTEIRFKEEDVTHIRYYE